MKTNKSYTKRIKLTKRGKLIARKAGINHFNAKESRTKQLGKRRGVSFPFPFDAKDKARYFPGR